MIYVVVQLNTRCKLHACRESGGSTLARSGALFPHGVQRRVGLVRGNMALLTFVGGVFGHLQGGIPRP